MTKDKETSQEQATSDKTEWQIRHEAFLKKKAEKEAKEQKKLEEEATRKKALLTENSKQIEDKKEEPAIVDTADDLIEGSEQLETSSQVDEVGVPQESLSTISEEIALNKKVKAEKKAARKKKRLEKRPNRKALAKALSIIVVALLTIVISAFIISPYSKSKKLTVAGLEHANEADVLIGTGIRQSDYLTTVVLNRHKYEAALVASNPWIKKATISYQFPNRFHIDVEENQIIAYAKTNAGYQPVLETGERMPVISEAELPETFLTVNLTDEKAVQLLISTLSKINQELVKKIATVNPVEGAVTKNLLLLEMHDGNQVRVPLSELEVKLPYYPKVVADLTEPSIVDMEVGIYTTTAAVEKTLAQEKAEREAKAKELEEARKQQEQQTTEATTTTVANVSEENDAAS